MSLLRVFPVKPYLRGMEAEPLLLCMETSSPVCSVALGRGANLLAEETSDEPNGHSRVLATLSDAVVRRGGYSFSDVDAFVVNSGPGSYTGLRIGMSTAKGLCYALDKPLIAIQAFDSMVHAFLARYTPAPNDLILPMIDARRMEVYTRVFNAQGKALGKQMAHISGGEGLLPGTDFGKIWLIGSGAQKMQDGLSAYETEVVNEPFLSARGLLLPALIRFQSGTFDDVAYTTPNYGKAWQSK